MKALRGPLLPTLLAFLSTPGMAAGTTTGNPAPPLQTIGTLELDAPAPAEATPPQPAVASIQVHNENGERTVANHGTIFLHDHILTTEGQSISVHLRDETVIVIAPSSDVTFNQFVLSGPTHGAQIVVDQGMVHLTVPKNVYSPKQPFVIRTRTVVMGVRGTEFVAEQTPGEGAASNLYTFEGSVSMGKTLESLGNPKASRLVEAGKSSTMEARNLIPAEPKRFNRKTLFAYLGKRAPAIVARIEHMEKLRREQRAAERKNGDSDEEKKKKPEWKKPRPRHQTGH